MSLSSGYLPARCLTCLSLSHKQWFLVCLANALALSLLFVELRLHWVLCAANWNGSLVPDILHLLSIELKSSLPFYQTSLLLMNGRICWRKSQIAYLSCSPCCGTIWWQTTRQGCGITSILRSESSFLLALQNSKFIQEQCHMYMKTDERMNMVGPTEDMIYYIAGAMSDAIKSCPAQHLSPFKLYGPTTNMNTCTLSSF